MSNILLNPGPTNTRFLTKIAQWFGSDVCHRTPEFSKILQETKEMLSVGFPSKHVAIMGGSGTAAMESMISSLIKKDIVVINAGIYGQRAVDMMKNYKIKYKEIKCNNITDLKHNKSIKAIYFVENETTTGEHFDVNKMASLYPNAKLYIDATSSFGASDYSKVHHRIEALCFCSNKCLQSTPGLGIVLFNKKCVIKDRSYYLSLNKYTSIDKIPFTLPVQSVYALHKTLKLINYSNQHIVFNQRRDKLIKTLEVFGIRCINKTPSNSIIGFQHPILSYEKLRDCLSKKGIIIYSGIPGIDNSFRLSTMSVLFDKKFNRIKKILHDTCVC